MQTKLYDQKGKQIWDVELQDEVFALETNEGLVHRALTMQLSNGRTNIAHTKTRSERRGSTRKIYKQKGTGRARMGSNRSPVRKKGWVAFGPRNNQNFVSMMNKKERRKALFCVLSEKVRQNQVIVVDEIKLKEMKTKVMIELLAKLPVAETILLAIVGKEKNIVKSAANIKYVKSIDVAYLNIKDLLKYKSLILVQDALEKVHALAK